MNSLPALLPWAALLLLLALKSNRRPAAWWIGLPVACGYCLQGILRVAADCLPSPLIGALVSVIRIFAPPAEMQPSHLLEMLVQTIPALTMGLGGVWLLAGVLRRKSRLLTFLGVLAVLGGLGVAQICQIDLDRAAGLFIPDANRDADQFLSVGARVTLLGAFVISWSVVLTGSAGRPNQRVPHRLLWLLIWLLIIWLAVVLFCVLALANGAAMTVDQIPTSVPGLFGGAFILAGLSFTLLLPFLALSRASEFYHARLQNLLGLGTVARPFSETPLGEQTTVGALPPRAS